MSVIIAGIHTGIGKTICSAILCEKLGYDYYKPVQAGDLDNSDSLNVKSLISNGRCKIHEESYRLQTAASPHYAAALEGIEISMKKIKLPDTTNPLVVETAGGVMSPLSETFLNLDLIESLRLPVILVSNNYLGSINHTLLSILALKGRNLAIKGLVFNGPSNSASEKFITEYSELPALFNIPQFINPDKEQIREFSRTLHFSF